MTSARHLPLYHLLPSTAFALVGCGGGPPPDNLVSCGEVGRAYSSAETFPTTVGCERLLGSLDFSESAVFEFAFLSSLRAADGFVSFRNARSVSGFQGMEGIAEIGSDLTIVSTPTTLLTSLDGLRNVDGDLAVESNLRLVSLEGLESLETVGGDLQITGNIELFTLSPLGSLERVEGDQHIYENPMLPSSEIDAFVARVSVGGTTVRTRP
jgi:hypothetical protein